MRASGFRVRASRLALAGAAIVALSAGCSIAPPGELRDDPEVQALKAKGEAAPAKLAIAPVEQGYSAAFDLEKDPGRLPAIIDRKKLT
ncbi:MAG TPA: hypothetical protein VHF22_15615, partial [Planctomycetota bacterium]|nr:hypothetical protein [Planctomycetota bacterium]